MGRAPHPAGGRVGRPALALAVAGTGALLLPADARAADLAVAGRCFATGQPIVVTGTSFTAGAPVTFSGGTAVTAQADPAGAFTARVPAPVVRGLGPQLAAITAVDRVNPANTATARVWVVREAFGSNLPIAGRPRAVTHWRFAGFARNRPIYAHFLLGGRVRGRWRFGVARGECGTLSVRAPRLPGVWGLAPGRWTLKLDQRMSYDARTRGRTVRFTIRRTPAA